MRAARLLWAELLAQFEPKDPRSSMLRTHCQTSGASLTEQDPMNNVIRTTIEAMAAVFGGTQSLHTNAYDEAVGLPTDATARVARNTQLILQEETGIPARDRSLGRLVLHGVAHGERRRASAQDDREVEELGGMTKAIVAGMPKLRIEECAARRQARIDRGEDVIVGVNKYRSTRSPSSTSSTSTTRGARGAGRAPREDRASRDAARWSAALAELSELAESGEGNLLEAAVEAARARATVGEISEALEKVYTRYRADVRSVSGVYGGVYEGDEDFDAVCARGRGVRAEREGRRPRMLVVKLGQDGHDRGMKVIATAFADLGFDVDVGPLFQTPSRGRAPGHRERRARGRRVEPGGRDTRRWCPS